VTKDIPRAVRQEVLTSDDVLTTRRALALGLTEAQCRRLAAESRERGIARGVLLVGEPSDLLRSRARAAQLLVPGGLLCGPTAARLLEMQGLPFFDADEPIHLLLPNDSTRWQRSGLVLHWTRKPPSRFMDCGGLAVVEAGCALRLLERTVDRETFVALADSAAHRHLITAEWLEHQQEVEAARSTAKLWGLVDGRSESPSETRVRLVLHDGGLPAPDLQVQVRDDTGQIIARLDMGWRRQRVALEVDSAEHDKPAALYRDRDRQNDLLALHWDVRRVTGPDATKRPAYVQQIVRSALAARA
jgi:hypothetical protein